MVYNFYFIFPCAFISLQANSKQVSDFFFSSSGILCTSVGKMKEKQRRRKAKEKI